MCKKTLMSWTAAAALFGLAAFLVLAPAPAYAQPDGETENDSQPVRWDLAIAISVSIGMSCLGAGYAVGKVGAAALGAASERPELMARALLFVALAEGIAIYGLLVSVLLWLKL